MNSKNEQTEPHLPEKLAIDRLSLTELFEKSLPNIYYYVSLNDLGLYKQEIVSDTYLTYWLKSQSKLIRNPEAYLFKIVHLKIKEYCRLKQKKASQVINLDEDSSLCSNLISHNSFLVKELNKSKKEKLQKIKDIIGNHLNENQRKIIEMKYFQEMSTREISQELNKSEDSVRHILLRGKQKIKNLLN